MGKITCSICEKKKNNCAKYQTSQVATRMACLGCRSTHCIVCHEKLSTEEITLLPEIKKTFNFCADCYGQECARQESGFLIKRRRELEALEAMVALQTHCQKCATCKEFNTSRDKNGRVTEKNCKRCATINKDKVHISRTRKFRE